MILVAMIFFNSHQEIVTFVTHLTTFVGTFYVALHNRNLPQWHITPLWYLGVACLLTCITIILQWTIGPEFPLSYWNMGQLAESSADAMVSLIAVIMFVATVRMDIRGKKRRQAKELDTKL